MDNNRIISREGTYAHMETCRIARIEAYNICNAADDRKRITYMTLQDAKAASIAAGDAYIGACRAYRNIPDDDILCEAARILCDTVRNTRAILIEADHAQTRAYATLCVAITEYDNAISHYCDAHNAYADAIKSYQYNR